MGNSLDQISFVDQEENIYPIELDRFNQITETFSCKILEIIINSDPKNSFKGNSINYSKLKYFLDLKEIRLNNRFMTKIPQEIFTLSKLKTLKILL